MKEHKYLVDVTIPIYGAVHFEAGVITRRSTCFHNYTIRPQGRDRYQVERSAHPSKIAFTLIDKPIDIPAYRELVERDYTEEGLFLKSVVMVRIMDGKVWRFFSDHKPCRLESYNRSGRSESPLPAETVAQALARRFRMPEDKIAAAFSWVQPPG